MIKTIINNGTINFDNEVNEALDLGWKIHSLDIAIDVFVAFMTKEKSARDDYKSDQYSEEEHLAAMRDVRRIKNLEQ